MHVILEKIMSLEDGEHEFTYESSYHDLNLDMKDFEGNNVFPDPIFTNVILKKTGHTYYLIIKTHTLSRFMCDRCLSDLRLPIEGSISVVYSNMHHDQELRQDDGYRSINLRQTNAINLDKDVRDILILSIPGKILCRPDCRGLCVQCGANLNEEPCEHILAREKVTV